MTDLRLRTAASKSHAFETTMGEYQARAQELRLKSPKESDLRSDIRQKIFDASGPNDPLPSAEDIKSSPEYKAGLEKIIPDMQKLIDSGDAQASRFVDAKGIVAQSLRGNISIQPANTDQGEVEERLANLGTFNTNGGRVAVIDSTGSMFIGAYSEDNIAYLESLGFENHRDANRGRTFWVPLSNAETIIGHCEAGTWSPNYGVHQFVSEIIGTTVMPLDSFQRTTKDLGTRNKYDA